MRILRAVVLGCGFPLAAQSVLHVGPGGYSEIRDAIAVAAPGDVIEVVAGNYAPFTLDKALTITALPSPPGTLVQIYNQSARVVKTVLRPPAGTRAFVTGIHFRNLYFSLFWPMDTRVERGTVCFEECSFQGRDAMVPALDVRDAEVVLRHCEVLGSMGNYSLTTGLWCTNSSVFAIDSYVRAGTLSIDSLNHSGDGITADDSQLHLVRVDVVGGNSNSISCFNSWTAGAGVRVRGTSRAWIADCTLRGGDGVCAAGGAALHNATSVPVQLARTTLTGGPGVPPGAPSVGPQQQEPLLGLAGSSVGLARGRPFAASYRTQPGWPVIVAAAPDVLVASDPRVAEWLLLPPAGARTFAVLIANLGGYAMLQTTVPPAAGLLHQRIYLQAFSGLGLPLRTAPPLGGVVR